MKTTRTIHRNGSIYLPTGPWSDRPTGQRDVTLTLTVIGQTPVFLVRVGLPDESLPQQQLLRDRRKGGWTGVPGFFRGPYIPHRVMDAVLFAPASLPDIPQSVLLAAYTGTYCVQDAPFIAAIQRAIPSFCRRKALFRRSRVGRWMELFTPWGDVYRAPAPRYVTDQHDIATASRWWRSVVERKLDE